ncbi:chemotaxis protein CheB, partial [Acinetobacter baumannii]|uniref:chemotaxis protein CheB n=1 Tax=Acinetobacter baumannii TaxID=470 RepID=UPI0033218732
PKLSFPVIIVLHQLKDGPHLLRELFSSVAELPVLEAESLVEPRPGHIYLAPADYHLALETDGSFSLSNDEPIHYSRPSIDVLFETSAELYRSA